MFSFPVVSNTLFSKTNIHDGTPIKLVTLSVMVSSTIACIFISQSDNNEILFFGVLLYSAQKGMLSISIAERSPKLVPFSLYNSLLPPRRKPFPVKSWEIGRSEEHTSELQS